MGIPFSRWGAAPFITQPLPFPASGGKELEVSRAKDIPTPAIQPFEIARRWRQEIKTDTGLTKAGIAKREGISRARVTQIMNLLHLPELIQQTLRNPLEPLTIGVFSERRLRVLVAKDGPTVQLDFWRKWLQELEDLNQN